VHDYIRKIENLDDSIIDIKYDCDDKKQYLIEQLLKNSDETKKTVDNYVLKQENKKNLKIDGKLNQTDVVDNFINKCKKNIDAEADVDEEIGLK
jgi:hypothetical protein